MELKLYVTVAIFVLLVVMSILILIGKGDWLISGYNTASPEEKKRYNIRRLRLVMGLGCIAISVLVLLDAIFNIRWLMFATVLPVCILIVILGNTWAKE